MKIRFSVSILVLVLASLACALGSPGSDETVSVEQLKASFDKLPSGDAINGEQIFVQHSCHTCHMELVVGPAFPGDPPLAIRAETRKEGYSPELYVYESIVLPSAHVVPGFQGNIMPAEYGRNLTEQELSDLIAYLMTLK